MRDLQAEQYHIQRRLRLLLNTQSDLANDLKPYVGAGSQTMSGYSALNAAFNVVIGYEAEQLVALNKEKMKLAEKENTNENTDFSM